ncbi:protein trichome birefringence-like 31 [Phtheirospermum japonicum]|uniref:Protein trichome birefringence-like 31 n=1 Tax=Phtheirospermum japonicum TaxID=374723 RepID=A0A830B294_9LAMI|nr:protein trichome birefringence-like 31 [Phtheirospermum japonicum]
MTTRLHLLFRLALVSVLTLGAARVILDYLKHNLLTGHNNNKYTVRMPIEVSDEETIESGCNVFEGKWIWDNSSSYPLYQENTCPFLVKQTTCLKNGRPDSFYQNWRWQPSGCNLPRFDGMKLMEMLRDKRLMFVGDSVQRSMFESMICLVQSALPNDVKTSLRRIPPRKVFKVEEFNATIEYYWAPFMIESISDNATNHTVFKRLVKLDSVAKHSQEWEGADFLIFESYVWWMYKPTINATYGSLDNIHEYNVTDAYRLALETWAYWIESSINPKSQKVFFATMSPTHLWSWEWKPGTDGNCFNETHPIEDGSYWGTGSSLDIMGILGDVLGQLKVKVTLLNITQLSEYRKDGHTSVYGERKGKLLTKEQRSDPKSFADCIHWCLPGVPDTWNEILYALLLQDYREANEEIK